MRAVFLFSLVVALVIGVAVFVMRGGPMARPITGPVAPEWELSFTEEFNAGTIDETKWNLSDPWGQVRNEELQAYAADAFELENGILRIRGDRRQAEYDGKLREFSSGMITTYEKFSQRYGRFEIRCRVPAGRGLWPAFWLLPEPLGWPPEIDVLEILGHEPTEVHMTHHWLVSEIEETTDPTGVIALSHRSCKTMTPMANTFYNAFDQEGLEPELKPSESGDYRSVFQRNRDRIIYTSAFRRLQNKTQVFLSGDYDFYRTRLTHSIEVSQIGRSICTFLRRKSPLLSDDFFIDPDLVEAACLAHDIGHPPFGHAGERTLNRLMCDYGGFEGNAQTLRMLTETIFSNSGRGMNPCRAFLDGILKYKTLYAEMESPENHFLYSPQERYLDFVCGGQAFPVELTPGKPRDSFRSIECEVMDWADDTAYSLNDLMDGINAGFITLEKLERWAANQALSAIDSKHVGMLLGAIRDQRVEGRLGRKVGDFIASCELTEDANFLSGQTNRHRFRLKIRSSTRREAELYKRISLDLVFRSQELHQLDHKADFVINRLFGVFERRYVRGEGRLRLLPKNVEDAVANVGSTEERARLVCDAIAGMTDGFATRTYKRLFDADFGSIADLV